mmetsp:Transcript_34937/g.72761  ORF Transcript_34937/g.72761 Transcript_34937/m.72761 type:complete len:87 (+) Transcript_34937:75-335(+)
MGCEYCHVAFLAPFFFKHWMGHKVTSNYLYPVRKRKRMCSHSQWSVTGNSRLGARPAFLKVTSHLILVSNHVVPNSTTTTLLSRRR